MAKSAQKKNTVPLAGLPNPIEHLLGEGWTEPQLAVAWNLKTDNTVRRLRFFTHAPSYKTAERMAETFGWPSAGTVLDYWSERVRSGKAAS